MTLDSFFFFFFLISPQHPGSTVLAKKGGLWRLVMQARSLLA